MSRPSTPLSGTNLSIIAGALSRPPELRHLPSGDQVLTLEVTVRPEGEPAESVPVAWHRPTSSALDWASGEEIVVVGRVRRRFFRAGGATQSRTELVAQTVVPARRRAAAQRAIETALGDITELLEE
ncbi:MAG: single-stranded DNA-binding protein [Actinomycetota bacterium]